VAGIDIVKGEGIAVASEYPAHGHKVEGGVRDREVSPPDFSLWLVTADLDDGASITWPAEHGDEAVFVVEGAFRIDGRTTPTDGAAVIEANVETTGTAVGPTRIVHVGPADSAQPTDGMNGAPSAEGHGVHVVGPGGTWAVLKDGHDSHYFADSSCPTCRITLLHVGREYVYDSAAHSHTEDELIHVIKGEILLGRQKVGVGDTLAIGGDVRYKFRGGDDGFRFLNYRRDASRQDFPDPDRPSVIEGGEANGLQKIMDLIEA
jgi:hypothetical protein